MRAPLTSAPLRAPLLDIAVWATALGPLALFLGALGFEHLGHLAPCHLCLLQRGPLLVAAILGVLAVALRPVAGTGLALRHALALAAIVLALGAGLAAYHAGVEWRFWPGPAGCSLSAAAAPATTEALAAARAGARIIRCDTVPWSLFGLSLAGYNVLISTALAALALAGAIRAKGVP